MTEIGMFTDKRKTPSHVKYLLMTKLQSYTSDFFYIILKKFRNAFPVNLYYWIFIYNEN